MRKIILSLAISLDGYICDDNGGYEWIKGHGDKENDTEKNFDFQSFFNDIDVVVMGSKAYEVHVSGDLSFYEGKKIIVATSREFEPKNNVEFFNGDICKRILEVIKEEGKNIWLYGGAVLTDRFVRENIVDEYILGVVPTILGNGRSLFKGNYPKIELQLDEYTVDEGITMLTYSKRNKMD
jgi:dihydrofolate reductase